MSALTFTASNSPSSLSTLILFLFFFFLASQEGKECYHAGGKMLFFTQTENSCPCVDLFSIEIHKLAFWIYPSVSAMGEGFFNVLTKPHF